MLYLTFLCVVCLRREELHAAPGVRPERLQYSILPDLVLNVPYRLLDHLVALHQLELVAQTPRHDVGSREFSLRLRLVLGRVHNAQTHGRGELLDPGPDLLGPLEAVLGPLAVQQQSLSG